MSALPSAFDPVPFSAAPWDAADASLGLREPVPAAAPPLPISVRRRRGFTPAAADPRASVSLRDDDGVLRWTYEPPAAQTLRGRARRAGVFGFGAVLRRFEYDDIGPNRIAQSLVALDAKLTPHQGLRQWVDGALVPASPKHADGAKPALLLVHGTFSNSGMWFDQLAATPHGRALLGQWRQVYGERIFAFDHPTLSVAPWLNALELHAALRGIAGPLDVVCHSRGGLVASWLLRLAPVRVRQVVFVGSPLGGTSLASPYRLRAALDMLANIANALSLAGHAASTVFPLAAGAAGLAKVLGRTLQLGAALPIADAAVALVPGLASQQRVSDHAETRALFGDRWLAQPAYAVVTADFEPNLDEPAWKFWTRFRNPGLQLANLGADVVFPGANDLVVDTDSMSFLGEPAQGRPQVLSLGKTATTFHTNYFRDAKVVGFLAERPPRG